ncbi:hypothetical protein HDEF_0496 [Candidatus Hamiltonella defensa 5AT (Acyrthosiphon pisum)]|uniref:Uncharacterized protein n=1 Tax=Hamiltonella defensa subsp. Acyrthosiphon pisum (strain 5AT) TaxID=572265 RepID=C4K3V7_HAMD5|nr:hypothetical protein HDEF_0496 [Candidatus Hamiltonella defensa 5AT (Acyrthosiphon pisum)]
MFSDISQKNELTVNLLCKFDFFSSFFWCLSRVQNHFEQFQEAWFGCYKT